MNRNQLKADFPFSEIRRLRHLKLKVYPIVILQLTTLSLLFSLSSASAAVVPAMVPGNTMTSISKVYKMEIAQPKEVKSIDYAPITDSDKVKAFVNDYFVDAPILAGIASCESHNRQYDSKGNVLRGEKNKYDVGVMQINELYHADEAKVLGDDIYTIDGNVAFAKVLYSKYGTKPWASSQGCWSKYVGLELARK